MVLIAPRVFLSIVVAGLSLACSPREFDRVLERTGGDSGPRDEVTFDAAPSEVDATVSDAAAHADEASTHDGAIVDAVVAAPAADAMSEPADAAAMGGVSVDGSLVDAGVTTLSLAIQRDEDDAVWLLSNGALEERLHFSASEDGSAGYTIEVGRDSEECRAGLRFRLPLARGTRVREARLQLRRVGPAANTDPGSTMRIHVFDSASVAAFDHAHMHRTPSEHSPTGLWSESVGGFHVGLSGATTTSGDLTALVQHVLDRTDWLANGYIGFVLTPDDFPADEYAQLRDSFAGEFPPTLILTY